MHPTDHMSVGVEYSSDPNCKDRQDHHHLSLRYIEVTNQYLRAPVPQGDHFFGVSLQGRVVLARHAKVADFQATSLVTVQQVACLEVSMDVP